MFPVHPQQEIKRYLKTDSLIKTHIAFSVSSHFLNKEMPLHFSLAFPTLSSGKGACVSTSAQ